ncbi:pentatricopeptide repeat-containing protein At4g32430, mitochondrial [Morus notabilis]|uniref:pentatricopeptide repeat-containing protein At4g32430, mitochondrial n=1 Tax=Morus notabilis TaxID=981085 RepID=UPI000CED6676|nr:pentatricopeptide repeat-containing protein At4g32430, mitochondrial [Morus notabilis]
MIAHQLNFKFLLRGVPKQRYVKQKNLHSFRNEHQLFDQSTEPDAASISRSMFTYLQRNHPHKALQIFKNNLEMGLAENVDEAMVTLALKACRSEPKLGRQIHGFAISSGFISHSIVSNSLMNMYSKSGQLESALCVFASLCNPSIVAWNTILSGFRKSEEAFDFALRMNLNGVKFDSVSYTTILAFCSDYEEFLFGIQLHCLVIKSGFNCEVFVGNALVSVYSRCENLLDARRVFDEMPNKDLVTWNAMISGYTQDGDHGLEAALFFLEMVRGRMELDHVSFTSAVSACGHEKNLELGKQIHGLVIKSGYGTHVSVCNVLISTYSKCEVIEDAKLVFREMIERNVVSWTSMVSINEDDAMNLFHGMRLDGVYPNGVTFVGLIHAITTRNLVEVGRKIHGFCVKTSFLSEQNVCNSFITMYAKFQSIGDCLKFFEELRYRDITSWNSIISGCSQNGLYKKALHMFLIAVTECKPNHYTFGSALSAIADAADISLKYGQRCHSYLIKHGLNTHPIISGALLDMYAKRGSICESQKVFDDTPQRSQFAWTALISAYASHGDYESMIKLFREMVREEVKPDSITFLSVLTACSRKGMVEMGRELFNLMVKNYKIEPSPEHYSCMVDLLGRAGKLEEAEEMLGRIPGQPGLSVLQSLLGACQMYGNLEMAERTAQVLMALEPSESGPYVLVSNLYAEKGEWEKVAKIRRGMRNKGVKKVVGFSWVDVGDVGGGSLNLHGFSAGDKSHPKSEEIFRMAKYLGFEMRLLSEREDNECLQENFSNIEYLESGQNGLLFL